MMNRVERMISLEQSTRPIRRSGCAVASLCDASYLDQPKINARKRH